MTQINLPATIGHTPYRRVFLFCLMLLQLVACASSDLPRVKLHDHPLVGRIWDVQQQRFIERDELLQQMLASEYLLLGERHDNPQHHQHQSWVIRQLSAAGKQAGVAFEMIDDQQGNLLAKHGMRSVDEVIAILSQFRTHWYYEQRYKGVFSAVLAAGYPLIPANLNRQRLKQLSSAGEDKLPPAYKQMLAQVALSESQLLSLRNEIMASHCNMLNDKAAATLVLSQRLRDAVMAHSLTKIRTPVKVFIAGAGHVRKDRGVPLYLRQFKKDARVMALGFTEVDAGMNEAGSYASAWGSATMPFDYVWFTPQVERTDMCAGIERHMQEINKKGKDI